MQYQLPDAVKNPYVHRNFTRQCLSQEGSNQSTLPSGTPPHSQERENGIANAERKRHKHKSGVSLILLAACIHVVRVIYETARLFAFVCYTTAVQQVVFIHFRLILIGGAGTGNAMKHDHDCLRGLQLVESMPCDKEGYGQGQGYGGLSHRILSTEGRRTMPPARKNRLASPSMAAMMRPPSGSMKRAATPAAAATMPNPPVNAA